MLKQVLVGMGVPGGGGGRTGRGGGHNPKKSGKFLSAPLIFSFPYAHVGGQGYPELSNQSNCAKSSNHAPAEYMLIVNF